MQDRATDDEPPYIYTNTLLLKIPGFVYWGALENGW